MKKNTLFILLIIGIALIIGIWRDHQQNDVSANVFTLLPLSAGTALQHPHKLPEFSLIDMNDKPFTNAGLKKHWTFLFFGYSQCPQICPTTLGAMKQISDRLGANPLTQFVFVSIDPEHDNPQTLKTYLQQDKFKSSPFIGLTGDKKAINALAQQVGVYVQEENLPIKPEHIAHGNAILLINPEGKLTAIFTSMDKTAAIIRDFKEIVHHYVNSA